MPKETKPFYFKGELGDTVCTMLHDIYVENRVRWDAEADRLGLSLERLAATAISGMIFDRLSGKALRHSLGPPEKQASSG